MKRSIKFLAAAAVLMFVVPAHAAWVDLSGNFQAAGLGSQTGLITDPTTDTLYALRGNAIRRYDAGTDSWTALTPSTFGGYSGGDNYTPMFYAGGKFLLRGHLENYAESYDIVSDSWSQSPLPTAPSGNYSHSQGATFDTNSGRLQTLWTVFPAGGGEIMATSTYDHLAGTWSAVSEYTWPSPFAHWGGVQSVSVGTTNYIYDDRDATPSLKTYDFTTGPFPEGVAGRTAAGNFNSGGGTQTFGQQYMAAVGTDIYVTGGDQSGDFAVYHTLTDTWENLDPYANAPGGFRDHSTAIAGGIIYTTDFDQFFANQVAAVIPEPSTFVLLVLAVAGLMGQRLVRRQRS